MYEYTYTHTQFELPPTAAWEMSFVLFVCFYMTKFQEYFLLQHAQFKCSWEAEKAARSMSESV